MANQILGDKFPSHPPLKQRNSDAGLNDTPSQRGPDTNPQAAAASDSTQVSRAHQRLSLEAVAAGEASIGDAATARRQLSALKDSMNAAPGAAISAHRGIDRDVFEAAMAQPTA